MFRNLGIGPCWKKWTPERPTVTVKEEDYNTYTTTNANG